MKRILSIFLIILLSCVINLNGETRGINKKALRRMIEHLTRIKNLLRNLEEEDTGSEESEESGNESSEESGSEPSEDGSQESEESGSEPSESGSQESEESGNESSEESTNQSSEESGSEPSESGSQQSQESVSQSSQESVIQYSQVSGIQFSQESGSQSSQESESTSSSSNPANGTEPTSSTPTAPPTSLITGTIITNNRRASIHFLGFNNFRIPQSTLFTFVVYVLFRNRPPASRIRFTLTILYRRRLRYLQGVGNETATCTQADSGQTGGNVKYFCTSPKDANSEIDQITISPIIIIDEETFSASSGDINFSEEAALAALNLEKQTKIADKMSELQNGQLIVYPNKYFVIKGDVDDYEGKVGDDLVLVVYDNSTVPSTPINVSCTVQNITNKEYEFKCTPTQSVKGNIYLSPMYYGNNAINLNMTRANSDYLSFSMDGSINNGTTIRNNPIYRKSSSGLSGGAIAGIVIACAVVLIIASIIAMMLRKPSTTLANNNSSVVGLRTIDNYTE